MKCIKRTELCAFFCNGLFRFCYIYLKNAKNNAETTKGAIIFKEKLMPTMAITNTKINSKNPDKLNPKP